MTELSIEQKTTNHINELVKKQEERNDSFNRDIISYFVKLKERKNAQILLKNQVRQIRHKLLKNVKFSRPLTNEEQELINAELRSITIGLEDPKESVLDYKIRKDKEFKAHFKHIVNEYPEMRQKFYNIRKEYYKDISLKAYKRSEVYHNLYSAIYHLITAYNNGYTCYHEKSIGFILQDFPYINDLMNLKDFNASNVKYFFMNNKELFEKLIHHIAEQQMSLFFSEEILDKFIDLSPPNIGKIEFYRTQMKIEKRLPVFMKAYTEYCELILND